MSATPTNKSSKSSYHGRKPARQSSEQRRLAILQAALRVMVRDGVRGVRHRAVAQEAGVPLSATTYYFKDIHDLLADALTLYAKDVMENFVNPFWVKIHEWLLVNYPLYSGTDLSTALPSIVEHMVEVAVDEAIDRLHNHRDKLMVEQAFWYAVLQDERLHGLALDYSQSVLKDVSQMLSLIGVERPQEAGRLILMTIRHLEIQGLLQPVGHYDRESMKQLLLLQVKSICRI
ncbi:MAG: TetR family transcriptional regulator [Moraxellaceae bacterium]|nr:TetR family transcriptional regulator [Pseudomonadales bacterium]MCP5173664.1 TetR family transcriptional regulator [Moraxellaceae bacterium]MCP5178229.1 TetR family transcriptional regulator [Moraxellaceae bacterium]HQV23219.1 TetR family transcriptional regulator [Agitococcus sp.]